MSTEDLPEIQSETSETFKRIVVGGMFGTVDSIGLLATVYSEFISIEKALKSQNIDNKNVTIKRIAECQLVISPASLKSIHDWITRKIIEYETLFGKIPTQEELSKRANEFTEIKADTSAENKLGHQYQ